MWEQTYERLIEILYDPASDERELKVAIAMAAISADRRGAVTSRSTREDFIGAIEGVLKSRRAGELPSDDFKTGIRSLFFNT